jgi:redox-sensitive bicupin YhaK (pirin superfamily)
MSAGRGVQHSEFNHAQGPDHALPADLDRAQRHRHRASYEQKTFAERRSAASCAWSPRPIRREGSVKIHADARLYAGLFDGAESADAATGQRPQGLRAPGARRARGQRPAAQGRRRRQAAGRDPLQLRNGKDAEVLVFDLES